ncbi:MAG: DUF4270 family protein, partial [Bacteroidota bacterium]
MVLRANKVICSPIELFVFDSLTLALPYDGYYWYDTLQNLSLAIHEVREDIELVDEDFFYTNTDFDYYPTPLATIDLLPFPNREEEIEIRLPDALGQEFLDKLVDRDVDLLVLEDFLEYFKGLVVIPDGTGGPILGFTRQTQLRLYFSDRSETPVVDHVRTFTVDGITGVVNFNQILQYDSGTPLDTLSEDENLPSSLSEGRAYLQGGSGTATRIELARPDLFRERLGEAIVNHAELRLSSIGAYPEKQADLPPSIEVYWINEDNSILLVNENATLRLDEEYGRETEYVIDVTDFVKNQLQAESDPGNALLLSFGLEADNVTGLVIGDQQHPEAMEL